MAGGQVGGVNLLPIARHAVVRVSVQLQLVRYAVQVAIHRPPSQCLVATTGAWFVSVYVQPGDIFERRFAVSLGPSAALVDAEVAAFCWARWL